MAEAFLSFLMGFLFGGIKDDYCLDTAFSMHEWHEVYHFSRPQTHSRSACLSAFPISLYTRIVAAYILLNYFRDAGSAGQRVRHELRQAPPPHASRRLYRRYRAIGLDFSITIELHHSLYGWRTTYMR